jgi:hypothetical protein
LPPAQFGSCARIARHNQNKAFYSRARAGGNAGPTLLDLVQFLGDSGHVVTELMNHDALAAGRRSPFAIKSAKRRGFASRVVIPSISHKLQEQKYSACKSGSAH